MFSSFTARGNGWQVEWSPDEPHLLGDSAQVINIQRLVLTEDEFAVTPTGPFIVSQLNDPHAVMLAIRQLYPTATFTDAPDLTQLYADVPDDVVF